MHRKEVPLYWPIAEYGQHVNVPNSSLVYLGGIFYGDQLTYPQDPVALASSQTNERHIRDDAPLLSKNISTAQWPSIYVSQCNIGVASLGHPYTAPRQPELMVNKKTNQIHTYLCQSSI